VTGHGGLSMKGKKHRPETIIKKLREADAMLAAGKTIGQVAQALEISEQTFHRWRNQYDGMKAEEAKRLNKKMRKNQFDFNDFLAQLEQIKKMGNIKDLMGMIPGMGKALKGIDIDDDSFKPIEAIIKSMTDEERQRPEVMNGSRRKRIANGSGTSVQEVNNLLKQFNDMKKLMKTMNKMGGGKKGLAALNPFGK